MIDLKNNTANIRHLLEEYCQCKVIKANQTAKVPSHPFISFTIITPVVANGSTYSNVQNGNRYKELSQTWSFTIHSTDDIEALGIALMIFDFFDDAGIIELDDNGIVVNEVGSILSRDNLITLGYEYRKGIDVTFSFISTIDVFNETIETVNIEKENKHDK